MEKEIESILKLETLVFDKIEFIRTGIESENELEIRLKANIYQKENEDVYRVVLILKGEKPKEYTFEIQLSGFFEIDGDSDLSEELKDTLITKNTVAILMPYLRSQLSLLTAQPGMESITLPVYDINKLIKD